MNESLHVYLGARRILLRSCTGIWRHRVFPAGEGTWDGLDLSSATLAVPEPARAWRRRHLHLYPGSALCKFMRVSVPSELRSDVERQAAAGAQMAYQFGLDVADWVFTLDAAAPEQQAVVCAMPRALLAQMHTFADAHRLKLAAVRPFAGAVWNAFRAGPIWRATPDVNLIAVEDDAFTFFSSSGGYLQAINTLLHRRENGLIDREVRRVSVAAGVNAAVTSVALPRHLHAMGPASSATSLNGSDYLSAAHYADFRDLVFPFAETLS